MTTYREGYLRYGGGFPRGVTEERDEERDGGDQIVMKARDTQRDAFLKSTQTNHEFVYWRI